jgi:hypothetical protein
MPQRPELNIRYNRVRSEEAGVEHVDVYFTPVTPLKYIKINFSIPAFEKIKLKTRFQILKETFNG